MRVIVKAWIQILLQLKKVDPIQYSVYLKLHFCRSIKMSTDVCVRSYPSNNHKPHSFEINYLAIWYSEESFVNFENNQITIRSSMKHHMKMLCVDDNLELRNSLAQQFINEGFEVETAEDGMIALEKIKANQYDIVLLDYKMPKMDGKGVLLELKQLTKNPYVIMLTAVDDLTTARECVKLGAKDYVSKPYDPEELLHVVIKVLGSGAE